MFTDTTVYMSRHSVEETSLSIEKAANVSIKSSEFSYVPTTTELLTQIVAYGDFWA